MPSSEIVSPDPKAHTAQKQNICSTAASDVHFFGSRRPSKRWRSMPTRFMSSWGMTDTVLIFSHRSVAWQYLPQRSVAQGHRRTRRKGRECAASCVRLLGKECSMRSPPPNRLSYSAWSRSPVETSLEPFDAVRREFSLAAKPRGDQRPPLAAFIRGNVKYSCATDGGGRGVPASGFGSPRAAAGEGSTVE